MRKRLVFRIDDVGYTPAYDMGAFRVFDAGIGSSADVMFDSPNTVEALKLLKDMPWLSIGWHRHLWESPVLPPEEVPSLVNEQGRFKWGHRRHDLMKEATYEDAYKEFDAEMKLCYSILGRYPDVAGVRADSDLPLEKAFKDIVEKYGIAYNVFSNAPDYHRAEGYQLKHERKRTPRAMNCDPKYAHLNYYSSDLAVNTSYKMEDFKDYNPLERMMALRWTEKEEVYLYGWHPGYCDDHILAESTCNIHRCSELQAALSEEFKNWIIENKIELVNQRDVLYGTNEFQDHLKEINSPLWVGNFK